MNRREIPLIEMIDYGEEHLRREGFVVMPFDDSFKKDPMRMSPHYHDFFQVSLLTGRGRLMHDFRETDVTGDTLFFLSPGQVHTVRPAPGTDGTIVSFTREFLDDPSGKLLELPFYFATNGVPWLSVDPEHRAETRAIFDEMQEEFDAAKPGAAEILRALLHILFVKAARWYGAGEETVHARRSHVIVRKFHQEVERHFHEWQSLEPYAASLGVSVNHLNDVVRETTGESAGEHVRLRRLLDAKRLLLYSELSVSEIGYQLAFKDPSYFSRFFRRYEGTTPVEFRSQIREKYQQETG
ncbi:helix-turn-helix domain-containing protein [Luteolibacter yonseiensis]|uniref:Helix-turn-helix domain-containing protein n=1 Tax=Luteolibacter yonseiensis TaxID=1144680 RepID=A0A934R341_9BACT|nr:helix-turn-helix domain-containing protein [Luteolibacter yonseiensis]MBK1815937.1 helix-turn-helix domain-containing protein [Luteolibacter yonseiensis]